MSLSAALKTATLAPVALAAGLTIGVVIGYVALRHRSGVEPALRAEVPRAPAIPAHPSRDFRTAYTIRTTETVEIVSNGDWSRPSTGGAIEGRAPNPVAAEKLAAYIEEWLRLLPDELLTTMQLDRFLVCSQLSFAGELRNAVPIFDTVELAYDVELVMLGPSFARHVFFHELYHMIDWLDDYQLDVDWAWARSNPAGTKYGEGGAASRKAPAFHRPRPGFVSWYAGSAIEEDKAELFAVLMTQPRRLSTRMEKDPVLQAKVALLKKRLKDYCSACDDAWWTRIVAAEKN